MERRVGKGGLSVVDEPVQVVRVGVAQEAGGHLFGGDADLAQSVGEPSELRIPVPSEAGIEKQNLLAVPQDQDVHVKWESAGRFGMLLHDVGHARVFLARPHEVEPFAEHEVGIGNRPSLHFSDAEGVDEGDPQALDDRLFLRGGGRSEGGRQGCGGAAEEGAA